MKKTGIAVCLVMTLLFAVSCKKGDGGSAVETDKAPDFALKDLQGNTVKLSETRGKVVLVEFWATWCPPCREAVPELNKVYERYRDREVEVFGISVDRGEDAVSTVGPFVKEHAVAYPVLIDSADVAAAYGVSSIPALFVIDKGGKVVKKHMGFMPGLAEDLSKEVESLL